MRSYKNSEDVMTSYFPQSERCHFLISQPLYTTRNKTFYDAQEIFKPKQNNEV